MNENQTTATDAPTTATVSPLRFTAHPAETVEALERIGLVALMRQREWTLLDGASGRVGVHPLADSSVDAPIASLNFDVADPAATADQLRDTGLDATWWDESFGRLASVATPFGRISISGETDDAYGHEVVDDPRPEHGLEVVAVIDAPDPDAAVTALGALGFAPTGVGVGAAAGWTVLRATASDRGAIAVRRGEPALDANGYATARLALTTDEPLDALERRLTDAGLAVEHGAGLPARLVVPMPDGDPVEIAGR